MIKGTDSKTGARHIELCLRRDGAIEFPKEGSGWFGLYLVTGGACIMAFRTGGNTRLYTLEPGTLLCLDDSLRVSLRETDCACRVTALCFRPTFLNVNMTAESLANDNFRTLSERHGLFRLETFISNQVRDRALSLGPEECAQFVHELDTIGQLLVEEDDWYWSCRIRSHLMDMLSAMDEIREARLSREPQNDSALFSAMTALVRSRLDDPPALEDMANRFGMNRNKLQAYFHRFADCSYLDYVQRTRLERAKYYLRFTELSLSEIAERTGFHSTHNFSRFFGNRAGESATEYRTRTVEERKEDFRKKL